MGHKDLLKFLKLSSADWEIVKIEPGKSEGYRKDRQVEWHVKNGKVVDGHVRDSGRLLVEQMFSVRVTLRPKLEEKAARNEVELIRKEAIAYAPKYKLIRYPKIKDGLLYEFMVPDLHLGRLTDSDEVGKESSPDLYVKKAESAVNGLLARASHYPIEKILFPIGNDFFNVNNGGNTTAHGTPQREDPRWQRTYSLGKKMIIGLIDTMTTIAPVEVLIVKGNHDEERIFYFGDTLASWFHNNKNVVIDHRPIGRKYYQYGKVMWLFAHGYYENVERIGALMPGEAPQMWANTKYHECHLGDKHHKKETFVKTDELKNGVMVRIFRSIADKSVWEFDKGFDSMSAAEGMLWHKETGLEAQFPAEA